MPLIVMLLVLSLVSQCGTAPQRRNWTPQAMLYLKGAQRHRSVLERTGREDGDAPQLVTLSHSSDELRLSRASFILLELLQRALEEGVGNPDVYPDYQELNIKLL